MGAAAAFCFVPPGDGGAGNTCCWFRGPEEAAAAAVDAVAVGEELQVDDLADAGFGGVLDIIYISRVSR